MSIILLRSCLISFWGIFRCPASVAIISWAVIPAKPSPVPGETNILGPLTCCVFNPMKDNSLFSKPLIAWAWKAKSIITIKPSLKSYFFNPWMLNEIFAFTKDTSSLIIGAATPITALLT